MTRFIAFLVCLLLNSPLAYAQFRLLEVALETPLDPGINASLSQTSDGFLWLGQQNGLFRLDGRRVQHVIVKDSSSQIRHTQNIQSPLFEDAERGAWFSTFEALHRLDLSSGDVKSMQLRHRRAVLTEEYRPFFFDRERSELYLRAGEQVFAYHVVSGNMRLLTSRTSAISYTTATDAAGRPTLILGARWMSPGLEVILPGVDEAKAKTLYLTDSTARFICTLPLTDTEWLLGTDKGLYRASLPPPYTALTDVTEVSKNGIIADLLRTPDGRIVASMHRAGLAEVAPAGDRILRYYQGEETEGGSAIYDKLFATRDGKILITQPKKGLAMLLPSGSGFTALPTPTGTVQDIAINARGAVSCLTKDGRVYALSEKDGTGSWQLLHAPPARLGRQNAKSLSFCGESTIVTGFNSVMQYSPHQRAPVAYGSKDYYLDGDFTEATQGYLLSTNGLETALLHPDRGTLRTELKITLPKGQFFTSLHRTKTGNYLLPQQGNQIWEVQFDAAGNYRVQRTIDLIGFVNCIYPTRGDTAYVGTNTGLYLLTDTGTHAIFKGDEQFPGLNILSLVADEAGILWLGTDRGLFALDPRRASYLYFSEADGLPSNRFLPLAGTIGKDGDIFMPTEAGIVAFQPRTVLAAAKNEAAKPYLEGLRINGFPAGTPLTSNELQELRLPYRKNTLSFQPAVIGLLRTPTSRIKYQLEEYDPQELSTLPGVPIRYANLSPGSYTLRLTAISPHGLPSGEKSLRIVIQPPYWQTWWFRTLAFLALGLLIALSYILLLRQERLRQQRLQQQQARIAAERDRIAGEVHDDLGGQLSSIMYLSEELLLTEAVPGTERELSRINELSRNSLQNVRDIIFALDNRRSTLANLGDQLRGAGHEYFQDRKVHYDYAEDLDRPDFVLTSRQKRNLTLVVKEAWHNIAKHAHADHVSVRLHQPNGQLTITVTDDGRGFTSSRSASATGGYGLSNMHEKAASIGGELQIESSPAKGTKLILRWPLPDA